MRYFKLILPDGSISVCATALDEDADAGDYVEITKEEYDELVAEINAYEDPEPIEPSDDDPVNVYEFVDMLSEIL